MTKPGIIHALLFGVLFGSAFTLASTGHPFVAIWCAFVSGMSFVMAAERV